MVRCPQPVLALLPAKIPAILFIGISDLNHSTFNFMFIGSDLPIETWKTSINVLQAIDLRISLPSTLSQVTESFTDRPCKPICLPPPPPLLPCRWRGSNPSSMASSGAFSGQIWADRHFVSQEDPVTLASCLGIFR